MAGIIDCTHRCGQHKYNVVDSSRDIEDSRYRLTGNLYRLRNVVPASYEDIFRLPENMVGEIISGADCLAASWTSACTRSPDN